LAGCADDRCGTDIFLLGSWVGEEEQRGGTGHLRPEKLVPVPSPRVVVLNIYTWGGGVVCHPDSTE
jgi:hypothetical protein